MPPNVILLMTDQQRADAVGYAGNTIVSTPHLDGLAAAGISFTNAFVQCPVCAASRAAIHTGRYPRTIRVPSMGLLPPQETTLAESLKRFGYATGMFGKLHLAPQGYTVIDRGVDRPVPDPGFYIADSALDTAATRAALEDPFKRNYGFDLSVGVEDMLWGAYVEWLTQAAPGLVPHHVSENWWGQKTHEGVTFGSSPPASRMFHPQVRDFFDSHMPAELHPSRFIAERTCEFIRNNADRPFFAHCSFVDPHHPFNAPEPFNSMYDPSEMVVPPPADLAQFPAPLRGSAERSIKRMHGFPDELWQWARANYYGMVSNIDACVGLLMETLDELGLREDTIIVFVSDHGEFVGGHRLLYKGSLMFDDVMKVPLVFTWPAGLSHGRRVDALVQEIDIYPTILSLVGASINEGVQGQDLADLLNGTSKSGRDHVFCELDDLPDRHYVDSVTVRTIEWKLNYFPGSQSGMMFNLVDDPEEVCNLYDDPTCAENRRQLMSLLTDIYHGMKDPLPVRLSGA